MKSQHWIILGILLLAVGWLAWLLVRPPATNGVAVDMLRAEDWVLGERTAPVVLVEYSDFQCPACAAYHPILKQLFGEFGKDMAFVYRHFPLTTIHRNAEPAARAAEAAGLQGKFWEMHELLFARQTQWASLSSADAERAFADYARELGLDGTQFSEAYVSRALKERVAFDLQSGSAARVNATPTFFLNGRALSSPGSYEALAKLIRDEIAGATQ